jgi:hypothetical protein
LEPAFFEKEVLVFIQELTDLAARHRDFRNRHNAFGLQILQYRSERPRCEMTPVTSLSPIAKKRLDAFTREIAQPQPSVNKPTTQMAH